MSDHFRRSDPRYDRKIDVEVATEAATFSGKSRNISLGGILIVLREALPPREAVRVRFRVPTQPEPIEATGEVRWCEREPDGAFTVGVRFNGLRAREVWSLNRFFQS